MKRSIVFFAVGACMLAACTEYEQSIPDIETIADEGELVEQIVFEVLPIRDGDEIETKASAVPVQNPNGGQTVNFVWEATDTVGIYPDTGSQVYFNIESGVGTSSVSFDGGGWALKQNSTYVSYYPFVGDIYLKRNSIPISFAGQKQIGKTSPFSGARYFLATEESTSVNGILTFTYSTLNTIINVNATLPAGTYTKASLTVSEPLFVMEGTYSLDDRVIVGTTMSNTLEIELEDFTLTEESTVPIYIMSAPVDLRGKEIIVRVVSDNDRRYECSKTPLNSAFAAGMRYGLTCKMKEEPLPNNVIYYTSIDGNTVTPYATDVFGANMVSNTYGKHGLISFNGDVTSIGDLAFQYCRNLTSIVIPQSVTRIGRFAFDQCNLTSILIPRSVSSIGPLAIGRCFSLSSIIVDKDNPYYDSRDDCNAVIESSTNTLIAGCKNTVIPNSITCIGGSAFDNLYSIQSIIIPSSVTHIDLGAFFGCSGLSSIVIPSSVESIGDGAFGCCQGLSSIIVDSGNSHYDSRNNCNAIVETSSNTLLFGCKNTIIPSSVTSIGPSAFDRCHGLTSIEIPTSVTSIGDSAFNHTGLSSIVIPESVNRIGYDAFWGCRSLIAVTLYSVLPPEGWLGMFEDTNDCPIFVPSESVEAYKAAEYWSDYADRIQAIAPLPEAIDLGLPSGVKWASFNLGASKPEDYGDYYAWGETGPKSDYSWNTYKWCKGSMTSLTKYNSFSSYGIVDNKTQLDLSDDAAHADLGGEWRMPTGAEQDELRAECIWTWTTQNGVNGYRVTSKKNGNIIFLPAAGYRRGSTFYNAGFCGYYWSSALYTDNPYCAYGVFFNSGSVSGYNYDRDLGRSVRPVTD
jgi:hypothetical protein